MDFSKFSAVCDTAQRIALFEKEAQSGLSIAAQMWSTHQHRLAGSTSLTTPDALVQTRHPGVSNVLDKVYGILGTASSSIKPDYTLTKAELFRRAALEIIEHDDRDVFRMFCCLDHDPDKGDLPSWVPDWSRPSQTSSLALSTSSWICYDASSSGKLPSLSVRFKKDSLALSSTAELAGRVVFLGRPMCS